MKKLDESLLDQFTEEQLKAAVQRKRTLKRARIYLPSAEASLARAQAKVKAYREALASDPLAGQPDVLNSKVKMCGPCDGAGKVHMSYGPGMKECRDCNGRGTL